MTEFTLAAYKNTGLNGHPVYAIKADGVLVGELAYVYRPKNAGGHAWEATVFGSFANVCWCEKDQKKCLEAFKNMYADVLRRDGLHADPASQALRYRGIYQDGKLLNP